MEVGIVGGTGDEGFGLALRLARAGHHVTIGSRSEEKGQQAARNALDRLGPDAPVDGTQNESLAARGDLDVLFVTVPYGGQADTYRTLKDHLPEGRIVCDCTSPLATAVGGRPWQVIRPWHGSAAEQAEVLLCGADPDAKAAVGALIEDIPDLGWADAGDLSMARVVEPLTALLVSLNRAYKLKDTGIALTGRERWGRPGS